VRGVTVVMVGHRQTLMAQLDRLLVIKEGVVEAFGATAQVLQRLSADRKAAARLSVVQAMSPVEAQA
jgi:ATP-binding cassette subfamily C exporter for protease/lipase